MCVCVCVAQVHDHVIHAVVRKLHAYIDNVHGVCTPNLHPAKANADHRAHFVEAIFVLASNQA